LREGAQNSEIYIDACKQINTYLKVFKAGAESRQQEIDDLKKDRRPPIKKKCPECGGYGDYQGPQGQTDIIWCDNCIKGEVYNYLSPEQWEAETGEKMLDSDPVWEYRTTRMYDRSEYYSGWYLTTLGDSSHGNRSAVTNSIVVARPGQPKPDDNWRPKK